MDYMDLCIPIGNGVLCMESLYSSGKSLWDGNSMENADWSREDVAPSPFQDRDNPTLPTLDGLKDKNCLLIQIFKSGKEFYLEKGDFGILVTCWIFGMLQLRQHWITLPLNPGCVLTIPIPSAPLSFYSPSIQFRGLSG